MMKHWMGLVIAAALLSPFAVQAKEVKTTLSVSGWHCGGCGDKTAAAIKEVKGVRSASADMDKKQITVAYDDAVTNEAALKAAVEKLGYSVGGKAEAPKKN